MIQLCPTVGAVGQPGEQAHCTQFGRAAALFPIFLYDFPCYPVNNRFMGIFKEIPLVLRIFPRLFRLIRHLVGFRRDGMAQILLPGENVIQCLFRPVVPGVQLGAGMLCSSCPAVLRSERSQQ